MSRFLIAVCSVGLVLWGATRVDAGLEAHWTFDTDFTDSSGNARNTTANNGASVTNAVGDFKIGGGALTLNGANQFAKADSPDYLGITGTASRTTSSWIKTSVGGGDRDQVVMSWGKNQGSKKWILRMQTDQGPIDGNMRVEVNGGYTIGSTVLNDGNWHHVATTLVDDGNPNVNEVLIYVDGVLEAVSKDQGKSINTASDAKVRIGKGHTSQEWDGEIDDVGIYNDALAAEKILAIYNLGGDLGYDLGDDQELFGLHEAGDANAVVDIDGEEWEYVSGGLAGGLGELVDDGNGGFSLALGANGSGVQTVAPAVAEVPEPASIAIWSLLGMCLAGYAYRRRK